MIYIKEQEEDDTMWSDFVEYVISWYQTYYATNANSEFDISQYSSLSSTEKINLWSRFLNQDISEVVDAYPPAE